jgi:hypothetical protein
MLISAFEKNIHVIKDAKAGAIFRDFDANPLVRRVSGNSIVIKSYPEIIRETCHDQIIPGFIFLTFNNDSPGPLLPDRVYDQGSLREILCSFLMKHAYVEPA